MIAESGSDEEQVDAACALANVAYLDDASEVAKAGGIAPLVQLVQGGSDEAKMYAAWALKELCHYEDNRGPVGAAGGIAPLVSLCKRGIDFSPSTELAVCLLGSVSQQAAANAPEEEEPAPARDGRPRSEAQGRGRFAGAGLSGGAAAGFIFAPRRFAIGFSDARTSSMRRAFGASADVGVSDDGGRVAASPAGGVAVRGRDDGGRDGPGDGDGVGDGLGSGGRVAGGVAPSQESGTPRPPRRSAAPSCPRP
ncbi:hypothetical protein JL722_8756 [Aureococcus anophagefferens]|nr:hypothetical protein JL722_8756 [Aureococcus anophagefferens]